MARKASNEARVLTAELERATLRELSYNWDYVNSTHFKRSMRRPVFALSDAPARLGRWVPDCRTIEISRRLLADHGWGVVIEVLKHEMAHQYVDEVLRLTDESAHGPAFRQVCRERGFDARAAGAPVEPSAAGDGEERVLDRVAKLLALAESPNEHEAQAAMKAAQRLMLKYNLESVASGRRSDYGVRFLGRPSGRINEAERLLACIIGDHFFVQAIWVGVWRPFEGKRGSVLEVSGSPENLEMAEYVHSFLTHTAERLWREYKRSRGIRNNADRRTFLAGVMTGFRHKLASQKKEDSERGLVWLGDQELETYFRARHPRVRWATYGARRRPAAFADGQQAGRQIVLHRGVSQGSSKGGLLLPSGSRR